MKLLRIHHVQITIPAGSEEDARAFYCGLLGLKEIPKPANILKRGGFWVALAAFQIHIGVDQRSKAPDSKEHIAFLVDSLDAWRFAFESSGIEVKAGVPVPGLSRFDIRDPFDNRLEFLQEIPV